MTSEKYQLHVCTQLRQGPNPVSCGNDGSNNLLEALKIEVLKHHLDVECYSN
jgi:hypothetical protein